APPLRSAAAPEPTDRLALEDDVALGDLVGRMTHERVRERGLARAVRAHDRVLFVRVEREVDTLDDLGAVLQRDVQVRDLEQCHSRPSVAGLEEAGAPTFLPCARLPSMVARTRHLA